MHGSSYPCPSWLLSITSTYVRHPVPPFGVNRPLLRETAYGNRIRRTRRTLQAEYWYIGFGTTFSDSNRAFSFQWRCTPVLLAQAA